MFNPTRHLIAVLTVLMLVGCASTTNHQTRTQTMQSRADLAARSASLLTRMQQRPHEKRIPRKLIADARCIGVFPSVIEAGLIVGGHHGQGLISCRQSEGGWDTAAPAVYSLSGGSVGAQIGAQKSSVVLLFETREAVHNLLDSQIELGTQLSVAAGPKGYDAHVSSQQAPVVAYVSGEEGLFAGANINGTKMSFSQDDNAAVYGADVTAQSLLINSHEIPVAMQPFNQALQRFAGTSQ